MIISTLSKKDINKQSAPNFGSIKYKNDNNNSESNDKRKPILKKNSMALNIDQVQNDKNKQNFDHQLTNCLVKSQEIPVKASKKLLRKIQNKKKSIFLELDQLRNSATRKNRCSQKKISFLPVSKNSFDENPKNKTNNSYKQSKVEIMLSNSNIMGSFWNNSTQQQLDFDIAQESLKNLKNSEVAQLPLLKDPPSIMVRLKKGEFYEAKKSDRIIQKVDKKKQENKENPKNVYHAQCLIQSPFSTAESHFFRKSTCSRKDTSEKQNLYVSGSQKDSLLVTLNPKSSQVLPKSQPFSNPSLNQFPQDNFFQNINTYRFLNRLSYKVKKFMNFNSNKQSLNQLIFEMTKVKCFTLLKAQIELKNLYSYQEPSLQAIAKDQIAILQEYIQKQKLQPHWRHIQNQFFKSNKIYFLLNEKIIEFLKQTLPHFDHLLTDVVPSLKQQLRTKETLSIQLQFKILKHLFYDIVQINLFEQAKLPVSLDPKHHKTQRLIDLIEKNKWFQKVPFNQISAQFYQLRIDFAYLDY